LAQFDPEDFTTAVKQHVKRRAAFARAFPFAPISLPERAHWEHHHDGTRPAGRAWGRVEGPDQRDLVYFPDRRRWQWADRTTAGVEWSGWHGVSEEVNPRGITKQYFVPALADFLKTGSTAVVIGSATTSRRIEVDPAGNGGSGWDCATSSSNVELLLPSDDRAVAARTAVAELDLSLLARAATAFLNDERPKKAETAALATMAAFVETHLGFFQGLRSDDLLTRVLIGCHAHDVVERVTDDLANRFDREVPSGAIGARLMEELRDVDPVAYVRYASIYRRFEEATDFVQEVKKLEKPHDTLTARLPGI
jgi:hypothetical protein